MMRLKGVETMEKVKVGLIGMGAIAESTHLIYLSGHPSVSVEAIVDIDGQRAEEVAKRHGVPHFFTTIEEMIRNVSVKAVFICTPNQTHISIAKKAAEKGIHVFIEKPIGVDLQEVKSYLAIAEENNIKTMVGMVHRFRHDVRILREYIEQQKFGDIYYVKAKYYRRRGTPKGWFTNKALSGGGAIMDIGVHVLDLAWWLIGSPKVKSLSGKTVNALGNYETKYVSSWESTNQGLNVNQVFDVEDFGAAWIRFSNGTVLSLETAWAMNGAEDESITIEILGDKGGATLSPLAIYEEVDGIFSQSIPAVGDNDIFADEINHFIECILTDKIPMVTGAQGYEVLRMLHAIFESSNREHEIHF